jgi:hypothetical protein
MGLLDKIIHLQQLKSSHRNDDSSDTTSSSHKSKSSSIIENDIPSVIIKSFNPKHSTDSEAYRIGNVGKFMTIDLIGRISTIGSRLSSNLDRMTGEEKKKYKQFLLNELRKLQEQETNDARGGSS